MRLIHILILLLSVRNATAQGLLNYLFPPEPPCATFPSPAVFQSPQVIMQQQAPQMIVQQMPQPQPLIMQQPVQPQIIMQQQQPLILQQAPPPMQQPIIVQQQQPTPQIQYVQQQVASQPVVEDKTVHIVHHMGTRPKIVRDPVRDCEDGEEQTEGRCNEAEPVRERTIIKEVAVFRKRRPLHRSSFRDYRRHRYHSRDRDRYRSHRHDYSRDRYRTSSRDRDRERDRARERDRERNRDRDRDRDRERDRDRDRDIDRERDRGEDRGRDPDREEDRDRDRDRERDTDRARDRGRDVNHNRDSVRDNNFERGTGRYNNGYREGNVGDFGSDAHDYNRDRDSDQHHARDLDRDHDARDRGREGEEDIMENNRPDALRSNYAIGPSNAVREERPKKKLAIQPPLPPPPQSLMYPVSLPVVKSKISDEKQEKRIPERTEGDGVEQVDQLELMTATTKRKVTTSRRTPTSRAKMWLSTTTSSPTPQPFTIFQIPENAYDPRQVEQRTSNRQAMNNMLNMQKQKPRPRGGTRKPHFMEHVHEGLANQSTIPMEVAIIDEMTKELGRHEMKPKQHVLPSRQSSETNMMRQTSDGADVHRTKFEHGSHSRYQHVPSIPKGKYVGNKYVKPGNKGYVSYPTLIPNKYPDSYYVTPTSLSTTTTTTTTTSTTQTTTTEEVTETEEVTTEEPTESTSEATEETEVSTEPTNSTTSSETDGTTEEVTDNTTEASNSTTSETEATTEEVMENTTEASNSTATSETESTTEGTTDTSTEETSSSEVETTTVEMTESTDNSTETTDSSTTSEVVSTSEEVEVTTDATTNDEIVSEETDSTSEETTEQTTMSTTPAKPTTRTTRRTTTKKPTTKTTRRLTTKSAKPTTRSTTTTKTTVRKATTFKPEPTTKKRPVKSTTRKTVSTKLAMRPSPRLLVLPTSTAPPFVNKDKVSSTKTMPTTTAITATTEITMTNRNSITTHPTVDHTTGVGLTIASTVFTPSAPTTTFEPEEVLNATTGCGKSASVTTRLMTVLASIMGCQPSTEPVTTEEIVTEKSKTATPKQTATEVTRKVPVTEASKTQIPIEVTEEVTDTDETTTGTPEESTTEVTEGVTVSEESTTMAPEEMTEKVNGTEENTTVDPEITTTEVSGEVTITEESTTVTPEESTDEDVEELTEDTTQVTTESEGTEETGITEETENTTSNASTTDPTTSSSRRPSTLMPTSTMTTTVTSTVISTTTTTTTTTTTSRANTVVLSTKIWNVSKIPHKSSSPQAPTLPSNTTASSPTTETSVVPTVVSTDVTSTSNETKLTTKKDVTSTTSSSITEAQSALNKAKSSLMTNLPSFLGSSLATHKVENATVLPPMSINCPSIITSPETSVVLPFELPANGTILKSTTRKSESGTESKIVTERSRIQEGSSRSTTTTTQPPPVVIVDEATGSSKVLENKSEKAKLPVHQPTSEFSNLGENSSAQLPEVTPDTSDDTTLPSDSEPNPEELEELFGSFPSEQSTQASSIPASTTPITTKATPNPDDNFDTSGDSGKAQEGTERQLKATATVSPHTSVTLPTEEISGSGKPGVLPVRFQNSLLLVEEIVVNAGLEVDLADNSENDQQRTPLPYWRGKLNIPEWMQSESTGSPEDSGQHNKEDKENIDFRRKRYHDHIDFRTLNSRRRSKIVKRGRYAANSQPQKLPHSDTASQQKPTTKSADVNRSDGRKHQRALRPEGGKPYAQSSNSLRVLTGNQSDKVAHKRNMEFRPETSRGRAVGSHMVKNQIDPLRQVHALNAAYRKPSVKRIDQVEIERNQEVLKRLHSVADERKAAAAPILQRHSSLASLQKQEKTPPEGVDIRMLEKSRRRALAARGFRVSPVVPSNHVHISNQRHPKLRSHEVVGNKMKNHTRRATEHNLGTHHHTTSSPLEVGEHFHHQQYMRTKLPEKADARADRDSTQTLKPVRSISPSQTSPHSQTSYRISSHSKSPIANHMRHSRQRSGSVMERKRAAAMETHAHVASHQVRMREDADGVNVGIYQVTRQTTIANSSLRKSRTISPLQQQSPSSFEPTVQRVDKVELKTMQHVRQNSGSIVRRRDKKTVTTHTEAYSLVASHQVRKDKQPDEVEIRMKTNSRRTSMTVSSLRYSQTRTPHRHHSSISPGQQPSVKRADKVEIRTKQRFRQISGSDVERRLAVVMEPKKERSHIASHQVPRGKRLEGIAIRKKPLSRRRSQDVEGTHNTTIVPPRVTFSQISFTHQPSVKHNVHRVDSRRGQGLPREQKSIVVLRDAVDRSHSPSPFDYKQIPFVKRISRNLPGRSLQPAAIIQRKQDPRNSPVTSTAKPSVRQQKRRATMKVTVKMQNNDGRNVRGENAVRPEVRQEIARRQRNRGKASKNGMITPKTASQVEQQQLLKEQKNNSGLNSKSVRTSPKQKVKRQQASRRRSNSQNKFKKVMKNPTREAEPKSERQNPGKRKLTDGRSSSERTKHQNQRKLKKLADQHMRSSVKVKDHRLRKGNTRKPFMKTRHL